MTVGWNWRSFWPRGTWTIPFLYTMKDFLLDGPLYRPYWLLVATAAIMVTNAPRPEKAPSGSLMDLGSLLKRKSTPKSSTPFRKSNLNIACLLSAFYSFCTLVYCFRVYTKHQYYGSVLSLYDQVPGSPCVNPIGGSTNLCGECRRRTREDDADSNDSAATNIALFR